MTYPLISVIVPVYNCREYIADCIQSIVSQSYAPLEIIMVDDGSTDGSAQICDKLSKECTNIKYISKPNGGASSARNAGLNQAQGEYIMFVDGDDMLEKDAVKALFTTLSESNSDIAEGLFHIYDNGVKSKPMYDSRRPGQKTLNSTEALEKILQFRLNTSCWGKIFRKGTIGQLRFNEAQTFNEDFDFLIKVYTASRPRISLTDAYVYLYRINPGSITHSFSEKTFELYDFADKCCLGLIDPKDRRLQKAAIVYRDIIAAKLFMTMRREHCSDKYPEQYSFFKRYLRRNALRYFFGSHYRIQDKAKMMIAFFS